MIHLVDTDTIGECWLNSIRMVMLNGVDFYDEDVKIKEIRGLVINVTNPQLDDKIINKYGDQKLIKHTLEKFSKGVVMHNRPFTYGDRIYNHYGVDQFEWLVNRLKQKIETKSATIGLLIAGDNSPNLPCLVTIDVKIRDNKLELQFFFRSQNIFGRQYANLLALVKLQQDLSQECHVDIGHLKGYVASAHIYEYDFKDANLLANYKDIQIQDKYYQCGPKSIRKDKNE